MTRYLLDTSALLSLRDNEAGAEQVAEFLYKSKNGQAQCMASFMTLMELLYRVWKDEGRTQGWLAYEQAQALPIIWIDESRPLLEKAAELKATYRVSLADAWIAASAILNEAILVHKDPEFAVLPCTQFILPPKM